MMLPKQNPIAECDAEAGTYRPRVNRNRCEAKAACIAACPCQVFEVRRIADQDFRALSILGRLKSRVHGRRTAYTPHVQACKACGLCVTACPEHAITLELASPSARSGTDE